MDFLGEENKKTETNTILLTYVRYEYINGKRKNVSTTNYMKKFVLLIFLISGTLNAQYKNTFEPATLSLRNNEVLEGEAKIKGDTAIVFRKNKNEKRINFTYRKVKKLKMNNEYYLFKIIAGEKPKLMKVLIEYPETINLYGIERSANFMTPETGPTSTVIIDYYHEFYVNKGVGDAVIKLGTSRPFFGDRYFKKTAATFFNDCPSLVKKIKDNELQRTRQIVEIIDHYVYECE